MAADHCSRTTIGVALATPLAPRRCSAMCAGAAGLVAVYGTARGIPTGDRPFLGCCRTTGTTCTAARFCARGALLTPMWCAVGWSGIAWRGVAWCGVVWWAVAGVVWWGVRCGLGVCGALWCGANPYPCPCLCLSMALPLPLPLPLPSARPLTQPMDVKRRSTRKPVSSPYLLGLHWDLDGRWLSDRHPLGRWCRTVPSQATHAHTMGRGALRGILQQHTDVQALTPPPPNEPHCG